jgi:hypothetical protein
VDFFAMRIVLPIVYFRRSIAAQEKFAQKVKECLMAKTLDLIMGYMLSHRMEPRGAGTGSDTVLTIFFTWKSCRRRSRRRHGVQKSNARWIQMYRASLFRRRRKNRPPRRSLEIHPV